MAHTFTRLVVHIIFSTKNREPFLDADCRPRVHAYLGGVVRELNAAPIKINGVADHVHLLCAIPPTAPLSDLLRVLKTNSSKWIHDTFPRLGAFAWQTGYAAFSVSESNVPAVETYVANQEEHHRTVSFQEEFVAFLKRHAIPYDPRYIWE